MWCGQYSFSCCVMGNKWGHCGLSVVRSVEYVKMRDALSFLDLSIDVSKFD